MNIQPISIAKNSTGFGVKEKRTNIDRAATVQDLYEVEERLKEHQEKLIKEQSAKLADALYWNNRLIWIYNNKTRLHGQDVTKLEQQNTFRNAQDAALALHIE